MNTLVHRRLVRQADPEPLGPGGTIGPLLARLTAPLTWIGWVSIVGAAGYLVVSAWPWLPDALPNYAGGLTPLAFLHQVASISTILLPAALEFGYPGVARRNPWLLRGTLLLALALLSRPFTGFIQDWASNALFQTGDGGQLDLSDIQFALVQALALTGALLQALGWLAFLRGLLVAHARPRDTVLLAFAVAGVAVWVGALLPSFDQLWASDRVIVSATNAIGILVGLCQSAATAGVVAALLTGAVRRLQPRLGWGLGAATAIAIAGATAAVLAQVLLGPSTAPDGTQDYTLLTVSSVLNSASLLLLLAASLAGIGRGTEERRVAWPRRRVHVVTGDRRLRPARGPA